MTPVELIERTLQSGVRLWTANGSLCYDGPIKAVQELIPAMKAHKAVLVDMLERAARDYKARKAGLVVYASGELYGTSPSRVHEVAVERLKDRRDAWMVWAGRWLTVKHGKPRKEPIRTWDLYKGPDFKKALIEAVRFAENMAKGRRERQVGERKEPSTDKREAPNEEGSDAGADRRVESDIIQPTLGAPGFD